MANFVYNIAKGRVGEFAERVQNNDPAASTLTVVAVNITGDQDAVLRDHNDLAAVLGDVNVTEANNTGYARFQVTDTVGGLTSDADDVNDRWNVDIADVLWSGVAADGTPNDWTDLIICYDPAGTNVNANMIPLTHHDFAVTPNGGDITAQVNDFFRAT